MKTVCYIWYFVISDLFILSFHCIYFQNQILYIQIYSMNVGFYFDNLLLLEFNQHLILPSAFQCRFGDGYTLTTKLGGENPQTTALVEYVLQQFPQCSLREQHFNMAEFQLPSADTILSKVFQCLEDHRSRFNIEDYSVSQTTLDQVPNVHCVWCCCIWCLHSNTAPFQGVG